MQQGDPYFGGFGTNDPVEGGYGLSGGYGSGGHGMDGKAGGMPLGATYLDDLEDAFLGTAPDMDTDGGLLFSKPHQAYESPFAPSGSDPNGSTGSVLSAKNVHSLPSFVPSFDAPFQSGLGSLPSAPTQWKPPQPPAPPPILSISSVGQMGVQDSFGAMDETASIMSSDSSVGFAGGHLPPWHSDPSMMGGMRMVTPRGSSMDEVPSVKRRAERNAREQKRSLKITEQISHLKEVLVGDGRAVKNSKMAILVEVEDYIKDLQTQVSRMDMGNASGGGGGGSDLELDMKLDISTAGDGGTTTAAQDEVTPGVDFRTLFKQVCMPMAVASIDGRFIDVNSRVSERARKLAFGISKSDRRVLIEGLEQFGYDTDGLYVSLRCLCSSNRRWARRGRSLRSSPSST